MGYFLLERKFPGTDEFISLQIQRVNQEGEVPPFNPQKLSPSLFPTFVFPRWFYHKRTRIPKSKENFRPCRLKSMGHFLFEHKFSGKPPVCIKGWFLFFLVKSDATHVFFSLVTVKTPLKGYSVVLLHGFLQRKKRFLLKVKLSEVHWNLADTQRAATFSFGTVVQRLGIGYIGLQISFYEWSPNIKILHYCGATFRFLAEL